jgi:hypothetical protein
MDPLEAQVSTDIEFAANAGSRFIRFGHKSLSIFPGPSR